VQVSPHTARASLGWEMIIKLDRLRMTTLINFIVQLEFDVFFFAVRFYKGRVNKYEIKMTKFDVPHKLSRDPQRKKTPILCIKIFDFCTCIY